MCPKRMRIHQIIPISGSRCPGAVPGTRPCLQSPGPPGSCCNYQENEPLQAPPTCPQCVVVTSPGPAPDLSFPLLHLLSLVGLLSFIGGLWYLGLCNNVQCPHSLP